MNRRTVLLIIIAIIAVGGSLGCEGGTSRTMQEDFDKIRLDHLLITNRLIDEYKSKTGYYPFENMPTQLPIVVVIQTQTQEESHKGKVPIFLDLETRQTAGKPLQQPERIETLTPNDLTNELERGLQRPITLPVDPQKIPVNKPSVYVYTYYLGVFDVTAFLHNEFPFARPLSPYNNKITVGNRSNPQSGIWTPGELVKQEEFRRFFQSPFNKPGYVLKTTL